MKTPTTINGFPIALIRRHGVWYACAEGLTRPGRTRREALDSLRHEWNRGIIGESLAWKALCRAIDRGDYFTPKRLAYAMVGGVRWNIPQ